MERVDRAITEKAHASSISYRNGSNPAILGSFVASQAASRRKRGPVAFRPLLSAGLAFSFSSIVRLSINGKIAGTEEIDGIMSNQERLARMSG
jgi:hypothetical protein